MLKVKTNIHIQSTLAIGQSKKPNLEAHTLIYLPGIEDAG
jgi:hypothetical protein